RAWTRAAILAADAVLVAGAEEDALDDVTAELDLRARVTRVRFGHRDDVAVVAPVDDDAADWALASAFRLAESRSLRLASVGDAPWHELTAAIAELHDNVHVEQLAPRIAVPLAAFN